MNIRKCITKQAAAWIAVSLAFANFAVGLASPLELSLNESIEIALKNNPAIQIAMLDREKSTYSLDEAKGGNLPSISLGSSYTFNGNYGDGSTSNNLRLSMPLYTGGRIQSQVEQAKLGVSSADLGVNKTKQQIRLDAAMAYYNVLQAQQSAAVSQEMVTNLAEHLNVVRAKYDAGVVAKSDLLRAEVELANAQQNLLKTQNNYKLAVTSLLNTLNIDADSEIILTTEFSYEPEQKTLEEYLAIARTSRPDIAQADINVEIAAQGIRIAESGKMPSLSFSASTGWKDSLLPDTDNWSLGLSANWNIFDAGITDSKVKQAKAALDKAKLQREQVVDAVEQEVRQSYLSMQEAQKRLETTQLAINKAMEDFYIAQEKYKAGVGTNLDVIDAQLALSQAKTNHIQALYDFNVNKAKLNKAAGL